MSVVTLFFALFMMGLLGSPHCLGMCGGIVSAFSLAMGQTSPQKKALLITTYHSGRLCSYMLLGTVALLFGQALLQTFSQSMLPRVVLGIALILVAMMLFGLPILTRLERLGASLWAKMAPLRQKVFPLTTLPKAFVAGLLWGFLPCGLVYAAIVMALGVQLTHGGATAIIAMLFFGLGTLPMLLLTQQITTLLQQRIRRFGLRQMSGAVLLLSGLLVLPLGGHDHSHGHSEPNHSHSEPHHAHHHHTMP